MKQQQAKEIYDNLFPNEESKAKAFDKIAEKYYYSNFGTISKTDLETLLFSIYFDRVLEKNESDIWACSDYNLSKQLGITQSKVSSLKVRKELIYPSENKSWRKSLEIISKNAYYDDGKIVLYIPDRNLYLELKNAIEVGGGFVETQLTTNLLKVRLPYFLDLMVSVSDEKDRDSLRNEIKEKIAEQNIDVEDISKQPFGILLREQSADMILDLIASCIPFVGDQVSIFVKYIYECAKNSEKRKKP